MTMSNASDQPVYDIFVSYAHVNDEPPPFVARGWVSTFVDTMKRYLVEELGRRDYLRLWMDYELRGNQSVTPEIHGALAASRVLVLFLSPGYLKSSWCMDELATFVARTRGQGGCIFPVYVSPVGQVPTPLEDLLRYRFWDEDERGRARRLADPQPDPAREPDYYRRQRDLAQDLARTLKALGAGTAPAADPRPARDGAPRSSGSVFVNGAQDDLDLVRHTARLLMARGLRCQLPITATLDFDPATPATEIRRDLEETLEDSEAILFLYRAGPAGQISRIIKDVRKLAVRNPRVPRRIDLCQPQAALDVLGIYDPDLQVIGTPGDCGDSCARACAEKFSARLAGTGP